MSSHVLVGFDGSPLSERALRYAIENRPDAAITTIYVIDPVDSVFDVEAGGLPVAREWHDAARDRASDVHETAAELADELGVDVDTVTAVGTPAREILEYADEQGVDHVVLGSHGRSGLQRAILGSVAETVTRRARVPVTVVG